MNFELALHHLSQEQDTLSTPELNAKLDRIVAEIKQLEKDNDANIEKQASELKAKGLGYCFHCSTMVESVRLQVSCCQCRVCDKCIGDDCPDWE